MQAGGKASTRTPDIRQPGQAVPKVAGGALRTRTFTGCRTCRSRHLKCDEARPVCSSCRRLGLECEGYEALLYWMPDQSDKQGHRGPSFRYPLFTEEARNGMSLDLVQSLGDRSAGDILLGLDAASPPRSGCRTVGPFGVFRAFDAPPSPSSSLETRASSSPMGEEMAVMAVSPPHTTLAEASTTDESLEQPAEFSRSPDSGWNYLDVLHQHWIDLDNDVEVRSRAPTMDIDGLDLTFPPVSPLLSFQIDLRTPTCIDSASSYEEPLDVASSVTPQELLVQRNLALPLEPGRPGASSSNLPAHADSLLRHYKEAIANPTSQSSGRRTSPWQLFFLPCALETFAELALWNTASHTRYSILYSLLSNSAFHLHGSLSSPERQTSRWLDVAVGHQEMAKLHLKKALQSEFGASDQAKYSEILMAVLALAMVSTFHSTHTLKILLLDAEGLIRLRGLPNPKTRKSRVLHHLYTHLRLMAESLTLTLEASSETQVSISKSQQVVELGTFRLSKDSLGNEFDLSRDKPDDSGYNDIHLEIPGRFLQTMYPEMYGIPESLMTLLSRTISLGNEMPKPCRRDSGLSALSPDLLRHVHTLEQNLWSWTPDPGAPRPDHLIESGGLLDLPRTRSMILALHQALLLYFYRRMHNSSAMLLQPMVQKTFEHLEECFEVTGEDQDFATTMAWSGFIASCESVTPAHQERGLRYLESIDNRGYFFGIERPSEIARQVWERREQSQDWSLGWLDVLSIGSSA
ncbi:hypothetical protein GQ53DRAFT_838636 [Thozetella sp. PMI_491]|nr:hypothetical protein GQ53DRAFT_838636 [Thozetella sp. PMI_491]